jgi:hypothetical protein
MGEPMRRITAALAIAGALLLSACQLVLVPAPGGSATACPTGSWQLSSEAINSLVTKLGSTLASNLSVTLSNNGVTAAINADGTWSLTAQQTGTFTGTLGGQPVSGSGVLDGVARGTYTKTATTIIFTTKSLTGTKAGTPATLTVSGTLGGTPFSNVVFNLPSTNSDDRETEVEDAVGLTGAAGYTCGAGGTLALTFSNSHIDMKFHH